MPVLGLVDWAVASRSSPSSHFPLPCPARSILAQAVRTHSEPSGARPSARLRSRDEQESPSPAPPRGREAEIRPGRRLPRRAPAAGRTVLSESGAAAAGLPADVRQDGRDLRLAGRVLRAATALPG